MQITLKAARVNANLTQKEVAERLGVAEKSISNWENGTHEIKLNALDGLCRIYNVDIGDIILPVGLAKR